MTQFVIGWNVGGRELIVLDAYSNDPRFFESAEEAQAIVDELAKDTGTCRVLPVEIVPVNDPPKDTGTCRVLPVEIVPVNDPPETVEN